MPAELKTREIEDLFKVLEQFKQEMSKEELTFQNLDELSITIREKYNSFKGQMATYRAFYNQKLDECENADEALKKAGVKLEEDPYEDYIKSLEDMNGVLTEMYTWVTLFLGIFELYSNKLEVSVKTARGLSLTKEVMERTMTFINENRKEQDIRFADTIKNEREMFDKYLRELVKRIEWSDKLFYEIAKSINKLPDHLKKEYLALSEKTRLPKKEQEDGENEKNGVVKLLKPVKSIREFTERKERKYTCEECGQSFDGEFLLIKHTDEKHRDD